MAAKHADAAELATLEDGRGFERYRLPVYAAINISVSLGSMIGAAARDMPFGVAFYVCALTGLCSAPLLLMRRFNDRYALLGIFTAAFFVLYGALDLQTLLLGSDVVRPPRDEFLNAAEIAVLLGVASAIFGYTVSASGNRNAGPAVAVKEWPAASVLIVGSSLWLVGTAASLYFQIIVTPSKLGFEAAQGRASLGAVAMFVIMLCQMMQPLGILILSYGYARYGRTLWASLIITVVAIQVLVGFVEDIKSQAMMAAILVIMTRTVVTSRMPKAWIAYLAVFVVVVFPIFQAYRVEVSGERGLNRAQALQQIDKVIAIVLASRDKVTVGRQRSETFLERASSKHNLEILLDHVGADVPYLYGKSLVAIPLALVPRLLLPDKQDLSVGLLFGKLILHADSGVFISITHLGELYWNFGWAGITFGMFGFGALLGFVAGKFSLEDGVTLTRVLLLLATAQPLCIGFEGTMPVSYLVWIRSLAAIGLLHVVFARYQASAHGVADSAETAKRGLPAAPPGIGNGGGVLLPAPRFPNLLR